MISGALVGTNLQPSQLEPDPASRGAGWSLGGMRVGVGACVEGTRVRLALRRFASAPRRLTRVAALELRGRKCGAVIATSDRHVCHVVVQNTLTRDS